MQTDGMSANISANTLSASSSNNNITLIENDDLVLSTVNAGSGNVSIIAASGEISDGNGDAINITAQDLTLLVRDGIEIDTEVSNIAGLKATDSAISIDETNDLAHCRQY